MQRGVPTSILTAIVITLQQITKEKPYPSTLG